MTTVMTPAMLLADVRAGKTELSKLPVDQLLLVIKEQEREAEENAKKAAEQATFGIKIGRNGTVSVTGFGRYGISLYDSQWDSLIPLIPAIARFKSAYADAIKARVENPIAEGSPNDFKPLKLKADSQFTAPKS
jgi:hypothetical protein